jgi:hypothetical protein
MNYQFKVTNAPQSPGNILIGGAIAVVVLILIKGLFFPSDPIDNLLREYEQLADEAIELDNTAGDQDITKTLAKLAKFQKRAEELVEKLGEYEDEMSEEQVAEFLRISFKLASIGGY